MDAQQFDRLTRAISSPLKRRRLVAVLSAVVVSAAWKPSDSAAQEATPEATCEEGQANCDGDCIDTCCNNDHCGACGNACEPPLTCFEGVCDCPSGLCCPEGEALCDGTCVATCCDNDNCGACGNVCQYGSTCFEGVCDCPSGNCGPVTPPGTGAGFANGGSPPAWVGAVIASAAASFTALWLRRERSPKPVAREVESDR